MKITRLGIIIPLFLLLVWGVGAQTYEPMLNAKDILGNPHVSNLVNGGIVSPLFGVIPNKLTLSTTYSSTVSYPKRMTSANYKPLEYFWELKYPGLPYREYHFGKDPVCVFPKSNGVAKTVEVTKWTIDEYDEDEPPPRSYGFNIGYGTTGDVDPPLRDLQGSKITVLPSWSPSPSDEVIFIVRFEVDCDVEISTSIPEYGILEFKYSGDMVANVIPPFPTATTIDNASGIIKWTVKNSDLQKGNSLLGSAEEKYCDYYVRLKMIDGIREGDSFEISSMFTPNADYEECPVEPFPERKLRVKNSHDPNTKTVIGNDTICIDQQGDVVVRYRIEYQNIGNGGAKDVTIEDWLDEKAFVKSVRMLGSKHPVADMTFDMTTKIHPTPSSGYVYWHFNYPQRELRGTEEDPYNIDFMEESTQSWLMFEVVYDREVLNSCNALMNNARITFDCNPEFYTRIAVAGMSCIPTNSAGLASPYQQPCQGCREIVDSVQFTNDLTLVQGESPGYILPATIIADINRIAGNNPSINWYPDRWITNGNSLNAVMSPLEDMTYSLIVSSNTGNCERFKYNFYIDVSDHNRDATIPIHIIDDDNLTDNRSTPVIIGGSRPFTYSWSNGSTQPSAICVGGRFSAGGPLTLVVRDAHDCTHSFTATVECRRRGGFFPVFVGAALIAGLLLWLILRRRRP